MIVPGDVARICLFSNFFYNLPDEDFFYHFNERLLHSEAPDEAIRRSGVRAKLFYMISRHNEIKNFLRQRGRDESKLVSIGLADKNGLGEAEQLLRLLGLTLQSNAEGGFRVETRSAAAAYEYAQFLKLNPETLSEQMSRSHYLYFKLDETRVPFPLDLGFLREVSGLELDESSFFQTLIRDERLSLLLSVLYRLAPTAIDFIGSRTWKAIYADKSWLMGMWVLADALRLVDGRLDLPGGAAAAALWSKLAGCDVQAKPMEFLKSVATQDAGKLAYFFTFCYFLPPATQERICGGWGAERIQEIYNLVSLADEERIKPNRLPQLKPFNFFTLLYALPYQGQNLQVAGGTAAWLAAIGAPPAEADARVPEDIALVRALLQQNEKSRSPTGVIQRFVSLCAKFADRPQLLGSGILDKLYNGYDEYNVLADFLEKVPLQKPETVLALFDWVARVKNRNEFDRTLYTVLMQSLLELYAFSARQNPGLHDYDRLLQTVVQIPLEKGVFYDGLFRFFSDEMKLPLRVDLLDAAFLDFALGELDNQRLRIEGENYLFAIHDWFAQKVREMMQTQEVVSLAGLLEINQQLARLAQTEAPENLAPAERAAEWMRLLPVHELGEDAPVIIRDRVNAYAHTALERDLTDLLARVKAGSGPAERASMLLRLKGLYLLPQLKDHLLAMVYALNIKRPDLRIFLSPNLIRLHDFSDSGRFTPWNFCGIPSVVGREKYLTGFYLKGGLSRLNIAVAYPMYSQIFKNKNNIIFSPEHVQALIYNLLDFFPMRSESRSPVFTGLLVELGLEMLTKAREDEGMKRELESECARLLAGAHYRQSARVPGEATRQPAALPQRGLSAGRTALAEPEVPGKFFPDRQAAGPGRGQGAGRTPLLREPDLRYHHLFHLRQSAGAAAFPFPRATGQPVRARLDRR